MPKDEPCEHFTGHNKTLATAMLNAHLYAQADRVVKEKTDSAHFVKQAKLEARRASRS